MFRICLLLAIASACVRTSSVLCDDGTTCAAGTSCESVGGIWRCITPDQRAACEGDEASCSNQGGVCHESDAGDVCIVPVCGDDIVDDPERCDDGNRVDRDGCSASCSSDETCGNAVIDLSLGEQCDDGPPTLSGDGCTATCGTEFRVWRDVTPDPPVRWSFGVARDPFMGVVMVGGASEASGSLSTATVPTIVYGDTYRWFDGGSHLGPVEVAAPRRTRGSVAYDPKSGRVLLYGGITPANLRSRDLWAWDGVQWTELPMPSVDPGARSDAAFACSPTRCILVGGIVGASGSFSNATYAWDGTNWTQLPGQPGGFVGRAGAALAYHAAQGQFVLFGGDTSEAGTESQTWTMADGQNAWTLRIGAGPPARTPAGPYPSAAYDEANANVVLASEGKTYTWNGTWTNVASGQFTFFAPTIAWDATRGRVTALARLTPIGGLLAHEWTGTLWSRSDVGLGAGTTSQAGAYDERTGDVIVVDDVAGGLAWDGVGWARRPSDLTARKKTRLAYDTSCGRMLAFGGIISGTQPSNELEELTSSSWRMITTNGPPARSEHVMAFDRERERLVVFGGAGPLDDLWIYAGPCGGGTWTQIPRDSAPWPPARSRSSLTYDRERRRLILFGGLDANNLPLGDTWELVGSTWREISSPLSPSARFGHATAFEPRTGRIVLFGGRTADGSSDELWELDGDTWKEVSTVITLNAREGVVLERDRSGFVVSLGGFTQSGAPLFNIARLHSEVDVTKNERCVIVGDDDGDGLAGCADPDCAARCTPTCAYGETCSGPHCGDGACASPLEDPAICPSDC